MNMYLQPHRIVHKRLDYCFESETVEDRIVVYVYIFFRPLITVLYQNDAKKQQRKQTSKVKNY